MCLYGWEGDRRWGREKSVRCVENGMQTEIYLQMRFQEYVGDLAAIVNFLTRWMGVRYYIFCTGIFGPHGACVRKVSDHREQWTSEMATTAGCRWIENEILKRMFLHRIQWFIFRLNRNRMWNKRSWNCVRNSRFNRINLLRFIEVF